MEVPLSKVNPLSVVRCCRSVCSDVFLVRGPSSFVLCGFEDGGSEFPLRGLVFGSEVSLLCFFFCV